MTKRSEVSRVAGRRYWREADARVVVEAWRKSGDKLSVFAGRHGVEAQRISRWSARLNGDGQPDVRFHPLRVVSSTVQSAPPERIEIQLEGGRVVRVPRGFESEDLQRVLVVLEGEA